MLPFPLEENAPQMNQKTHTTTTTRVINTRHDPKVSITKPRGSSANRTAGNIAQLFTRSREPTGCHPTTPSSPFPKPATHKTSSQGTSSGPPTLCDSNYELCSLCHTTAIREAALSLTVAPPLSLGQHLQLHIPLSLPSLSPLLLLPTASYSSSARPNPPFRTHPVHTHSLQPQWKLTSHSAVDLISAFGFCNLCETQRTFTPPPCTLWPSCAAPRKTRL
ncbi:uncharacterized protein LY79DRAFT_63714 [Colletotrichum navitas]|uniref:Uncharacterized protein n=1 Tax=Colletotrichum navitas TaxID=681940 RepID=A0AAD8Q5S0_9PEZI|nr:uncharacterized protein LY79DRAFT_63714 [Colletotrichum navitas]KAK1596401.1 hypothetical protein LY79DRAFT_63714 [Colletotrichum navitas]